MRRAVFTGLGLAMVVGGLTACGEKPQTATARKADSKPWEAAPTAYSAPGFKAGDAKAWEEQLRTRAQAQNEYQRTGASK